MAERVLILLDCLPRLLQTLAGDNAAGNRLFLHLVKKVLQVAADPVLEKSVEELRWRCQIFDQLRCAMRIADAGGLDGLLQAMLADTPLVKNLSNPHYMHILLDGRPNLEALFADLDTTAAANDLEPNPETDRILPGFKALTKLPDLPIRISMIASAASDGVKSNRIVWPFCIP